MLELFNQCGYEISISSYESATMKSKDSAYLFYVDIKNISDKRIKLHLQKTTYTTNDGHEIDQDVWLGGYANGVEGISIKSGAFKRAGLVYFKSKLSKVSAGDTLEIRVVNEAAGFQHLVTLRSDQTSSAGLLMTSTTGGFSVVSVEEESYERNFQLALEETGSNKSTQTGKGIESGKTVEITNLVERLELIEEKFEIRFEGILARARKRLENSPPDYVLEVLFDVIGLGAEIKKGFHPTLSVYNSNDQLIGIDNTFIYNDNFIGIKSCRLVVECAGQPARLRLHPTPS